MWFHGTPGTHSGSATGDGTLINQSNKMGMTQQYFHTISTTCAILPTMPCVCCVHRRVLEGSGVGSAGCVYVVHVDVHGELVVLWVAAT